MAAISSLYGMQLVGDKNIWSWHEICQIKCHKYWDLSVTGKYRQCCSWTLTVVYPFILQLPMMDTSSTMLLPIIRPWISIFPGMYTGNNWFVPYFYTFRLQWLTFRAELFYSTMVCIYWSLIYTFLELVTFICNSHQQCPCKARIYVAFKLTQMC